MTDTQDRFIRQLRERLKTERPKCDMTIDYKAVNMGWVSIFHDGGWDPLVRFRFWFASDGWSNFASTSSSGMRQPTFLSRVNRLGGDPGSNVSIAHLGAIIDMIMEEIDVSLRSA